MDDHRLKASRIRRESHHGVRPAAFGAVFSSLTFVTITLRFLALLSSSPQTETIRSVRSSC